MSIRENAMLKNGNNTLWGLRHITIISSIKTYQKNDLSVSVSFYLVITLLSFAIAVITKFKHFQ